MTMQVVLGARDGVLMATDTKQAALFQSALRRDAERSALETGKVRVTQHGAEKVLFNESKTIAMACSGSDLLIEVGQEIVGSISNVWNGTIALIEELCSQKWKTIPTSERQTALSFGETVALIVDSKKQEALKILFEVEKARVVVFKRRDNQKFVLLGGDITNPAGMILERYAPEAPSTIDRLLSLAAHYILIGGVLNPAGVGGLAIYFSRNGTPFEEVPNEIIGFLVEESKRLDKRVRSSLLRPRVSFDSGGRVSLKPPKRDR
ncbi:MAG TPA: hypothetical protein VEJ38_17015 [Candidatus Acidoferrales bacterium]|nr:hypothetical protein [Candidatus Acidoferrales bacterium]